MLSTKHIMFRTFLLLVLLVPGTASFCQQIELIDTTDYLPLFYSGALNNNLMVAASHGYEKQIEILISKGADINATTNEGATPLIFAIINDQPGSVRKLLEYGPDLNSMTDNDETPLLISVKNNNLQITEILIRAGAEIDLPDSKGATPIHFASLYGYFELTDLLLYYGADCNIKTKDGTSPLMAAIVAGYTDLADLLIQNGANLEARDKDGFTPLLIAAQTGDTTIMKILLNQGVDIYETNRYKYNALDLAIESNHKEAVELLLEKGSDWGSAEKGSINPHTIATSFGRKDIIEILNKKNIPGRVGFRIDEISISPTFRFNSRDYYTGGTLMFREPMLKAGIVTGFEIKPVFTRVLIKTQENTYYQYYDKSSIIYGGIFKDFTIKEYRSGVMLSASASLSAGYSFGPAYRGTNLTPENQIKIIPSAGIDLKVRHFGGRIGFEYINTQFYGVNPVWIRIGFSYNYFLNKALSPTKTIKWN